MGLIPEVPLGGDSKPRPFPGLKEARSGFGLPILVWKGLPACSDRNQQQSWRTRANQGNTTTTRSLKAHSRSKEALECTTIASKP